MQGKNRSIRTWRLIAGLLLILILQGAGTLWWVSNSRAQPEEPIEFNHQVMVQLGITCLFCHSDAMRSPAAGMPSVQKCMGCHSTIATNTPDIQTLAGFWQRQEPVPWLRRLRLPRFVYFSHRVHVVVGGLNCERCHGDVGHMTVAEPVVDLNMGWCLSCHDQQPNKQQLRECVVCHQ
ncbi:MAG: cytochrome c3 family protein [Anaerolineae bacterium]|jgi:hypothetical protein